MGKPYRQKTRKGKRDIHAEMDWVLENSGWPMFYCKICGRTVGRYPPNETRINRDRCLSCIVAGREVNDA